jgi:hypothetical protein
MKFGNTVRVETLRYLTKITALRRKACRKSARSKVLVAKHTVIRRNWIAVPNLQLAKRGVKLVVHITVVCGNEVVDLNNSVASTPKYGVRFHSNHHHQRPILTLLV